MFHSYRLLNLYEIASWFVMKPFEAADFYKVGKLLERLGTVDPTADTIGSGFFSYPQPIPAEDQRTLDLGERENLKVIIEAVRRQCGAINLKRSTQYALHIIGQLNEVENLTNDEAARLFRELDKHVRWDMEQEFFMHIPSEQAKYYNEEKPLGEEVYQSFPAARFDLTQAGNCLAAGVYTASGLHLMRAAEVALWELGRDRQIPLAQSQKIEFSEWGTIISELEPAIKAIQQWPNSATKENAHKFYNSALMEIRAFNDGIRRHLAHVRPCQVPMEQDEALANWGHISRFMNGLATKIGAGRYMPLIWS